MDSNESRLAKRVVIAISFLSALGLMYVWLVVVVGHPGVRMAPCRSRVLTACKYLIGYAEDHKGQYPSAADALCVIDEQHLQCAVAAKAGRKVLVQYIPGQSRRSDPENILVYDSPDDHKNGVLAMLVNDELRYFDPPELLARIRRTKDNLRPNSSMPASAVGG